MTQYSPTTQSSPRLLLDELDGVVSTLSARFPTRSRAEIAHVVDAVYGELSSRARIPTHLIPLTLNVSRRLLSVASQSAPAATTLESGTFDHSEGDHGLAAELGQPA